MCKHCFHSIADHIEEALYLCLFSPTNFEAMRCYLCSEPVDGDVNLYERLLYVLKDFSLCFRCVYSPKDTRLLVIRVIEKAHAINDTELLYRVNNV